MTDGVVEVRVYKLKPGMRTAFQAAADEVMEMLARHRISVVGHGPSAHDADSYYLIRAYPSLEEREQTLQGFYGSEEWAQRFNDRVTGMIESYNTAVLDAASPALSAIAKLAG